jgi:hypothetical protein
MYVYSKKPHLDPCSLLKFLDMMSLGEFSVQKKQRKSNLQFT